jgi:hypothetical protein
VKVERLLNDLEKNQSSLTALQTEFQSNAALSGEWTPDDDQLLTLQQNAVQVLILAREPLKDLESERDQLQQSFERFKGALEGANQKYIEQEAKALRQAMADFDAMHKMYLEYEDPSNPGQKVQAEIDAAVTSLEQGANDTDVKQRRDQRKANYLQAITQADADTKTKNEAVTNKTKTKGEREQQLVTAEKTRDEKKAERDKATKEATMRMADRLAREIAKRAGLPENSQLEEDMETYLESPEAQSLMKGKESNMTLWYLILSFMMGTFKQEHSSAQRRAQAANP